jgi:putative acetyltransferase
MSRNKPMVIRAVQPSDLTEIARLFYETVHHVNAQDYTPEQIEAWAPEVYESSFWADRFQNYPVYVAEEEGQVVGFAEFDAGHIDCFYVHHQWQRCGVGSQLMAHIEADARSQNIPRLFSEVSVTARPFFERHGFCVEREHNRLHREVLFQQFLMEKPLNPNDSSSNEAELETQVNADLTERLGAAIANLEWQSEADYPFTLKVWEPPCAKALTAEQFLVLVEAPPESTIAEVDFSEFFAPAIQHQDWYAEDEVAIAQRYQQLVNILQTELTMLQVFKVGQQELDIYILGQTPSQQLIGLITKAIET